MIAAIADTHAAIWYLFSDPRLGRAPSAFIDRTIADGDHIGVSAITLAEMAYLVEKARIPASNLDDLYADMGNPRRVFQHIPLDKEIAMTMKAVSRQDIPDMPDRIIAATALFHGVPLLSRDGRIRSAAIQTIW